METAPESTQLTTNESSSSIPQSSSSAVSKKRRPESSHPEDPANAMETAIRNFKMPVFRNQNLAEYCMSMVSQAVFIDDHLTTGQNALTACKKIESEVEVLRAQLAAEKRKNAKLKKKVAAITESFSILQKQIQSNDDDDDDDDDDPHGDNAHEEEEDEEDIDNE